MPGFRGPLFVLGLGASAQQAGYRNPLPVPPIAGEGVSQAGFRNPLPIPPIGGEPATQGGFRSPLPVPPIGGEPVTQAGFVGVVPLVNIGGTAPTRRRQQGGGGGLGPIRKGRSGPTNIRQREEQEILALIAAFVEILE